MSRTFDDSLTADLEGTFFNANEFAPTVTIERGKRRTTGVSAIVATLSRQEWNMVSLQVLTDCLVCVVVPVVDY